MIDQESEKIRAVAWSEICPWLCLFRTFRLAIRIRALLLGAVAAFLTVTVWAVLGYVFSGDSSISGQINRIAPPKRCPWTTLLIVVPDWPMGFGDRPSAIKEDELPGLPEEPGDQTSADQPMGLDDLPSWSNKEQPGPIRAVWQKLSEPFALIFSADTGITSLIYLLLCGLSAVLIWAFFGGAITRSAALELAADERIGTRELVTFVARRWRAYAAAPLFPLLGVLLAVIGIFVVGFFLKFNVTMWVAAVLWPLLLVGGLMMAVLLLGLCFGWPLMWPTISSEGTDSFDALSRTYAYLFQKPLHYLFYVVVAGLFGLLGWLLVANFAAAVIALTDWAASWGCGNERFGDIVESKKSLGAMGDSAAVLIDFWRGCVKLLAVGFLYSYFWTAATAIYFLLRRDVDATEMDEIFVEEEETGEVYGLPRIDADEQGAPTVDESGRPEPDKPE